MLNVSFKFIHLLMGLLMLLPAQLLLPLHYVYWPPRRVSLNLNAYQTFLSSAKAILNQEEQKLLFIDTAVCDAKHFRMLCLASPVDIFVEKYCSTIYEKNSARQKQFTKQRFINKQTVEKQFVVHIIEIYCNSGSLVKIELSLLVIKLTTLRWKLIH